MEIHNPHGEDAHGSVTNVTGYGIQILGLDCITTASINVESPFSVAKPIQLPAPSRGSATPDLKVSVRSRDSRITGRAQFLIGTVDLPGYMNVKFRYTEFQYR
eukprot:COSAG02_NODE_28319_length_591_cov_8.508130_1_plen_103_part_00